MKTNRKSSGTLNISYDLLSIYTIILLKSVEVSKLQVAILARSSREMSQTVCVV